MGIFDFLKRKKVVGKQAVPATGQQAASTPAAPTQATSEAQCAAITAAGAQCKSSSRENSKYCGRHKGHRAANGAAKTGTTAAAPATSNGKQVAHGDYRLFQNGNRFYFSKKTPAEAKESGASPVHEMPSDRTVVVTPNGLPVLKKT